MNYKEYKLNDFVTDEYFIEWIKFPNKENDLFWQNWISQNPQKKELIEEARQIILFWSSNAKHPSQEDFDQVKNNIFKNIKNVREHDDKLHETEVILINTGDKVAQKHKKQNLIILYKIAAAFTGLLILSSMIYLTLFHNEHIIYRTGFGETMSISLPDSSKVELNANSVLKVPKIWNDEITRKVSLEGEAFFQVCKKKVLSHSPKENGENHIKFIVNADNLDVEVIGTKFNVNNRRGIVRVALTSGQINLKTSNEKLVMKPGEMVEFSPSNEAFLKKNIEVEKLSSWRHKKLIFEEASMEEIAEVIEDNYGLKVEFKDESLINRRFTGAVPYQDVDLFLTVLAESLNINILKSNGKVLMSQK